MWLDSKPRKILELLETTKLLESREIFSHKKVFNLIFLSWFLWTQSISLVFVNTSTLKEVHWFPIEETQEFHPQQVHNQNPRNYFYHVFFGHVSFVRWNRVTYAVNILGAKDCGIFVTLNKYYEFFVTRQISLSQKSHNVTSSVTHKSRSRKKTWRNRDFFVDPWLFRDF
jgi:hypothetical protein